MKWVLFVGWRWLPLTYSVTQKYLFTIYMRLKWVLFEGWGLAYTHPNILNVHYVFVFSWLITDLG